MIADTVTFDLGSTTYGQPLTLTLSRRYGRMEWHLRKSAANQRDDEVLISGITDDSLRKIGEALVEARRIQGR